MQNIETGEALVSTGAGSWHPSLTVKAMQRLLLLLVAVSAVPSQAGDYDPLIGVVAIGAFRDLVVSDDSREREIPVLVSLPAGDAAAAVILFSHGLGGSRRGNAYIRDHWTKRGYATVFMQHPGSDEVAWRDEEPRRRFQAMAAAASVTNMRARVGDVGAILDALESWNSDPTHPLNGKLDLEHIGMAGHSFGARTTQAVAGQAGWSSGSTRDPRLDAAVVFSPSSPKVGSVAAAFGAVDIPWLLMTGTEDVAAIGGATVNERLAVFPVLPAGNKYELVFDGGAHHAFTDHSNPRLSPRNPNHHRVIKAFTTAFWDAFLRDDSGAAGWLKGTGSRDMLEPGDRWQMK